MTYYEELETFIDGKIKSAVEPLEKRLAELEKPPVVVTPPIVTPPVTAPSGWKLSWQDDFTGTALDPATWTADVQTHYGSGNGHTHINTNRPRNLTVANSELSLIAQTESPAIDGMSYSAAHVSSKGKREFTFGKTPMRFEVRAKWAMGPGFLPCPLWLRPVAGGDGEIDIVESETKVNTQTVMTVHQSYKTGTKHKALQYKLKTPFTEYHVYAVEIESTGITFYVDGEKVGTLGPNELDRYDTLFAVDRKWYIHVTQAVGGTWVGDPTSATKFPAPMVIDYMKAYTK